MGPRSEYDVRYAWRGRRDAGERGGARPRLGYAAEAAGRGGRRRGEQEPAGLPTGLRPEDHLADEPLRYYEERQERQRLWGTHQPSVGGVMAAARRVYPPSHEATPRVDVAARAPAGLTSAEVAAVNGDKSAFLLRPPPAPAAGRPRPQDAYARPQSAPKFAASGRPARKAVAIAAPTPPSEDDARSRQPRRKPAAPQSRAQSRSAKPPKRPQRRGDSGGDGEHRDGPDVADFLAAKALHLPDSEYDAKFRWHRPRHRTVATDVDDLAPPPAPDARYRYHPEPAAAPPPRTTVSEYSRKYQWHGPKLGRRATVSWEPQTDATEEVDELLAGDPARPTRPSEYDAKYQWPYELAEPRPAAHTKDAAVEVMSEDLPAPDEPPSARRVATEYDAEYLWPAGSAPLPRPTKKVDVGLPRHTRKLVHEIPPVVERPQPRATAGAADTEYGRSYANHGRGRHYPNTATGSTRYLQEAQPPPPSSSRPDSAGVGAVGSWVEELVDSRRRARQYRSRNMGTALSDRTRAPARLALPPRPELRRAASAGRPHTAASAPRPDTALSAPRLHTAASAPRPDTAASAPRRHTNHHELRRASPVHHTCTRHHEAEDEVVVEEWEEELRVRDFDGEKELQLPSEIDPGIAGDAAAAAVAPGYASDDEGSAPRPTVPPLRRSSGSDDERSSYGEWVEPLRAGDVDHHVVVPPLRSAGAGGGSGSASDVEDYDEEYERWWAEH